MQINITKKDLIWSYISLILQMTVGVLVLPFVIKYLPSEEVGFNYVMLTIGSMVTLLDFGFSPQLGRNVSYIFGGAQKLSKEDFIKSDSETEINWTLLSSIIDVSKKIYRYMSFIALVLMLSLGTIYVYNITDGFTLIENVFIIWLIYSVSVYFNIYVSYYNSLLTGSGKVKEAKYAIVASRITYMILCYTFIFNGLGLLGLSIAYLIQPFISLLISKKLFYTKELKEKLKLYPADNIQIKNTFDSVWYNAKKLGINNLGAYGINKMGMFLAGLYLTLDEISSYGLMIQLLAVIGAVSSVFFNTNMPQVSALRVNNSKCEYLKIIELSIMIYYIIFISGFIILILFGSSLLRILGSSTSLPCNFILIIYSIVVLLENNHSLFATVIVTGNKVPFVKAGIISGLFITLFSFISLKFTDWGILGLVLAQGGCQLAYNNWKWPKVVLEELNISLIEFIKGGFTELKNKLYSLRLYF